MTEDRSEAAVQRIEAALARIARAADAPVAGTPSDTPPANVLALVEKHEALRETVTRAIGDIDAIMAELDR